MNIIITLLIKLLVSYLRQKRYIVLTTHYIHGDWVDQTIHITLNEKLWCYIQSPPMCNVTLTICIFLTKQTFKLSETSKHHMPLDDDNNLYFQGYKPKGKHNIWSFGFSYGISILLSPSLESFLRKKTFSNFSQKFLW